jgi:hypothetical protein
MTDKELWDAAWKELTLTTDSYPAWKKKGFPVTSHWSKAKVLGEQIDKAPDPIPPEPVPTFTVSQSITAGQVITAPITWSANPSTDAKVEFYIDGALRWTEGIRPYEFNGDGNKLDPSTLTNGPHEFKVVATASDGATASTATQATAQAATAPPVSGKEGRVGFMAIMAGGWLDASAKDPSQHDEWLANYDRVIAYGGFGAAYVTPWYPRALDYIDSYAIYPGGDMTYALKDASGAAVWMGGYVGKEYAADVGSSGWRSTLVNRCKDALTQGYKGVFLDDVNLAPSFQNTAGAATTPINPRTGSAYSNATWRDDFCGMLEQVRQAIPSAEICHNSVWFHSPNHDAADASTQRQVKAANLICYERGFCDTGISTGTGSWSLDRYMQHMDNVHKAGAKVLALAEGATTLQQAKFNLGCTLLVSTGGDYEFGKYQALPTAFWPGYMVDLGAAKGPRYSGGTNIVKRDFDKGTVSADFGTRTATIPGVA